MQPEAYRHDYTAIEQHLRQLEAPAYRDRLVGRSILILAIAAAGCVLLLSAGYAWRLATEPQVVEKAVERIVPAPTSGLPQIPKTAEVESGIVTTNFTLFRETEVRIGGETYLINAGHKYLTETDTIFTAAWCYTNRMIDDVSIRIDLGVFEPGSVPIRAPVGPRTLTETGLTPTDHAVLFERCPWLSGNPNVRKAEPGRSDATDIDGLATDAYIYAGSSTL